MQSCGRDKLGEGQAKSLIVNPLQDQSNKMIQICIGIARIGIFHRLEIQACLFEQHFAIKLIKRHRPDYCHTVCGQRTGLFSHFLFIKPVIHKTCYS